ncbi:hypothetical protein ACLKA6_015977 [Drosophila palustris]
MMLHQCASHRRRRRRRRQRQYGHMDVECHRGAAATGVATVSCCCPQSAATAGAATCSSMRYDVDNGIQPQFCCSCCCLLMQLIAGI